MPKRMAAHHRGPCGSFLGHTFGVEGVGGAPRGPGHGRPGGSSHTVLSGAGPAPGTRSPSPSPSLASGGTPDPSGSPQSTRRVYRAEPAGEPETGNSDAGGPPERQRRAREPRGPGREILRRDYLRNWFVRNEHGLVLRRAASDTEAVRETERVFRVGRPWRGPVRPGDLHRDTRGA